MVVHWPMAELAALAGLRNEPIEPTFASMLGLALAAAVLLAGGMLLAGGLGWAILLSLGVRTPFGTTLAWTAYGLIPVSLGQLAGGLVFAIVRPLTNNQVEALALGLKPYSFGLISILPEQFPILSFNWFLGSYLDVFGLWALALLIGGARLLCGVQFRSLLWLGLELMLVFIVIITGLWLASQRMLVELAR